MDNRIKKYLEDINICIEEINTALDRFSRNYIIFETDFVYRKFIERNIEIIGEAMNRALKLDPELPITNARKIVDTRNYVIHAYDSLFPDILWAIVINHIPLLKQEVTALLNDQ